MNFGVYLRTCIYVYTTRVYIHTFVIIIIYTFLWVIKELKDAYTNRTQFPPTYRLMTTAVTFVDVN